MPSSEEAVRIVPLNVASLRAQTSAMTESPSARHLSERLPHLRHHWQERNRGKDDRWQECRDCGKKRPVREGLLEMKAPLPPV